VADPSGRDSGASLREQVLRASVWSTLAELCARVFPPLVFVVVARLLGPADYGVASAGLIVLSFTQTFWDAGLGRALIQYPGELTSASNVVFWTNAALAAVVYAVLWVLAPWIANSFFKDARVADVVRVQALGMFFGAASIVQTALFQRALDFKRLFWVRTVSTAVPGLASIPLAATGFGYWALVAGSLVGQGAQAALLWMMSHWRPAWRYDRTIARELAKFGAWVTATGLLGWFYTWGDSLWVGMYLNPAALGLYRAGAVFVMSVFGLCLSPLLPVAYPTFVRLRNNRDRLVEALLKMTKLTFFMATGLGVALSVFRRPLALLVFGQRWAGIENVIGWLGLTMGVAWLVGLNSEAYRAVGRPDVETKIMSIMLPVYLAGYWVALRHGLAVFLQMRFALAAVAVVVHLRFARCILNVGAGRLIREVRFILAAGITAMLGALLLVDLPGRGSWTHSLFVGGLIVGAVGAGLVAIELPWLREIWGDLMERRKTIPAAAPADSR